MLTFEKQSANAFISRPDTYGNRFFITIDNVHKSFIWGWTTSCFVSPYSAASIIADNQTQREIRKLIESYQENPDYTEIATLEDYKTAINPN